MKGFIKKKAGKNQAGPGFRTSDHFRGSLLAQSSKFGGKGNVLKFNPAQFKTQHKG